MLKLKSSAEEDSIRMLPESSETHVFFPDSLGDDLILEVKDSKGSILVVFLLKWLLLLKIQVTNFLGKIQLYINYSTSLDENNLKCSSVAETVAYDLVLEVTMKIQHFQQRNLLIHGLLFIFL